MIDVRGIPPELLLKHLYNKTHPQGMGFLHYDPTPMTTEEAKQILAKMKVGICGPFIHPELYDRDNFPGACQEAVNAAMDEATAP